MNSVDPDEITSERLAPVVTPIVNAAVQRYVSRALRRYVVVVAAGLAVLLIALLLPNKVSSPNKTTSERSVSAGVGDGGTEASGGQAGQQGGASPGDAGTAAGGSQGPAGAAGGSATAAGPGGAAS